MTTTLILPTFRLDALVLKAPACMHVKKEKLIISCPQEQLRNFYMYTVTYIVIGYHHKLSNRTYSANGMFATMEPIQYISVRSFNVEGY